MAKPFPKRTSPVARPTSWGAVAALVALALGAGGTPTPGGGAEAPGGPLAGVGFDQKLDARIPLDLVLRDESGAEVRLGDYFHDRPVILSLVYFSCPMLCPYVLGGEVKAMNGLSFDAGREFEVVTVSFDPSDTPQRAASEKAGYLRRYARPGAAAGWHFLTGDAAAVRRLADAVGFRYHRIAGTDEFAHAAGIMVATPDGRLSRYLFGVEYAPEDLRLALVEASNGKIGSPVDALLLYCCRYDPKTGKYDVVIMNVMRLTGAVTLVLLSGLIAALVARERRRRLRAGPAGTGEST